MPKPKPKLLVLSPCSLFAYKSVINLRPLNTERKPAFSQKYILHARILIPVRQSKFSREWQRVRRNSSTTRRQKRGAGIASLLRESVPATSHPTFSHSPLHRSQRDIPTRFGVKRLLEQVCSKSSTASFRVRAT